MPSRALLALLSFALTSRAIAAPVEPSDEALRGIVAKYCVGCHSNRAKTANLVLEGRLALEPAVWEKVIRRLRARQMPPAGLPRPDEAAYRHAVATLEAAMDALPLNPGRTDTFRRLTRFEYQNSIRDLLGVEIDASSMLPADESGHGFDNVTVGDLSPVLLERYLNAARVVSRLAVGIAGRAPGGETYRHPPDLTQEQHFEQMPFGTRGGMTVRHHFPVDGEYEVQIRLARDRNEHVEGIYEAHQVDLMLDGARVEQFTVTPPPQGKDHSAIDRHLTKRWKVPAGQHRIDVAFVRKHGALMETERQPYQAHFNMDRHPRPQPAIYEVTVNGPFVATGADQSATRKRSFVCKPTGPGDELACAQRIVRRVARLAYRRPVTVADVAAPMKFFREGRKEGFDYGIEMALRSILVSPEFLFRIEPDPATPGTTPYRLSDLAIASRLSFFLWSSIPDETLLSLAATRRLRQPGVLEAQVARMLADKRSAALVENFAGQWLQLRKLAAISPDMRAFADFDENLRIAFRRETELFFESLLKVDGRVTDLVRANYTFLNERLAKHYGIANVYGSRFRRVEFPLGAERGGLLRQGSILTVTSYPTRTSPVIRGKWVLENLLGTAPPPPPPSVPTLKEQANALAPKTMRERLAQHRENPACFGCHQLMDPTGFALENYDAVGRWRTREGTAAIDTAGSLPDGSKFNGVAGLESALLARPELLASTVTEKLMTYALGRGVEHYDAPAVRKIVREAAPGGYRLTALIAGIVRSAPFQMRGREPVTEAAPRRTE